MQILTTAPNSKCLVLISQSVIVNVFIPQTEQTLSSGDIFEALLQEPVTQQLNVLLI